MTVAKKQSRQKILRISSGSAQGFLHLDFVSQWSPADLREAPHGSMSGSFAFSWYLLSVRNIWRALLACTPGSFFQWKPGYG